MITYAPNITLCVINVIETQPIRFLKIENLLLKSELNTRLIQKIPTVFFFDNFHLFITSLFNDQIILMT